MLQACYSVCLVYTHLIGSFTWSNLLHIPLCVLHCNFDWTTEIYCICTIWVSTLQMDYIHSPTTTITSTSYSMPHEERKIRGVSWTILVVNCFVMRAYVMLFYCEGGKLVFSKPLCSVRVEIRHDKYGILPFKHLPAVHLLFSFI